MVALVAETAFAAQAVVPVLMAEPKAAAPDTGLAAASQLATTVLAAAAVSTAATPAATTTVVSVVVAALAISAEL